MGDEAGVRDWMGGVFGGVGDLGWVRDWKMGILLLLI